MRSVRRFVVVGVVLVGVLWKMSWLLRRVVEWTWMIDLRMRDGVLVVAAVI
jgi:hypothetical protein